MRVAFLLSFIFNPDSLLAPEAGRHPFLRKALTNMIKNILGLYCHRSPENPFFRSLYKMDMKSETQRWSECGLHRRPCWNAGGPLWKPWQDWKWTFIFILLKCLYLSPLLWKKSIQGCWMNLTCSFSSCTFCLHIQHWVITFLKTGTLILSWPVFLKGF